MGKRIFLLLISFFFILISSCSKTDDKTTTNSTEKGEFGWKDGISGADIPDFPIKGYIDGKEVQFQYINFEKWRGSNDNVLTFSMVKPAQNCGFIEGFSGFTIMNKGAAFNHGEWVKAGFADEPKSYQAFFKTGDQKSNAQWNCALNIETITDKSVKGKIALFFNDSKKSWVAGKFEALLCSN